MTKTKTRKLLPKTSFDVPNGGIYLQRVRCGKKNCKCARGETHQAYYFFTRINGKLTKTYIRKAELEEFSQIVCEAQYWRWSQKFVFKRSNEAMKRVRNYLRENKDEIEKRKRGVFSDLLNYAAQLIDSDLDENQDDEN